MLVGEEMTKTITNIFKFLFLISSFNAFANPSFYEYRYVDNKKNIEIILRFSNANVNKYPGWKHARDRAVNVSLWYPSLIDASSPNVWMSSKEEQRRAEIKPSEKDRKITLRLGNIGGNHIVDPMVIIQGKTVSACKKKQSFEKYIKDGTVGIFDHYKSIGRPNSSEKQLYVPSQPTKGIGCVKCNGLTCQLFGISNVGIEYVATEKFKESNMIEDVIDLHKSINQYIENKRINN